MGAREWGSMPLFLCHFRLLGVAEPVDDVVEITVGVEAAVTLELGGDVFGVGFNEKDDSDGLDDAVGFIDAVADVVGFAGGSEAGAGWLGFIEALEPRFAADDDDVAGAQGAVAAPFVPAVIRTTGMLFEEELIEDHADATGPQPLGEDPHALALGFAGLAVAKEDFGHGGWQSLARCRIAIATCLTSRRDKAQSDFRVHR